MRSIPISESERARRHTRHLPDDPNQRELDDRQLAEFTAMFGEERGRVLFKRNRRHQGRAP